jgi:hypothetical protein
VGIIKVKGNIGTATGKHFFLPAPARWARTGFRLTKQTAAIKCASSMATDANRLWNRWPVQRPRALMKSV